MKNLSSELQSSTAIIPFYNLWALLRIIPRKDVISEVALRLVLISIVPQHEAVANENRILDLLKIGSISPVHKPFIEEDADHQNIRIY